MMILWALYQQKPSLQLFKIIVKLRKYTLKNYITKSFIPYKTQEQILRHHQQVYFPDSTLL